MEDILKMSGDAGVSDIVQIGIDLETSINSREISRKFSTESLKIHYSMGLHPTDIRSEEDFAPIEKLLRENVNDPALVAIGEIGIDLYHDRDTFPLQEKLLRQLMELAAELKLPVIIHSRDASEETWRILNDYKGRVTGVIHCYTYDYEYAKRFIDLGYYISFSGILVFKNAHDIHETAGKIPLETILIETDAPFLAPPPHRGKRNDPSNLPFILEKLFSLREEEKNTVERTIYKNSKKFLNRKAYYA